MSLRESKGNMYTFVTHTWNPIKGRCPHGCEYCYMKRFPLKEQRLDEKELRTNLGSGNFIFVGSGTDMWATGVPEEWIERVGEHCRKYPDNTYLFQTKNPSRYLDLNIKNPFSKKVVLGTTIETNQRYPCMGKAPNTYERADTMHWLQVGGFRTMITIEPILDFDITSLMRLIRRAGPEWINIGADSGHNNLPEPQEYKIRELIEQLREITQVHLKSNLARIYKED